MEDYGTWTFENNEGDDCESWKIIDESSDGRDTVAIVPKTGDEDYDDKVTYPNARLISSAPDLLRAVESAAIWFGELGNDDGAQGLLDDLKAAIRKAKGN